MPRRSFSFFLHGHLPWVLGHGRWPHGAEWLCEAAVESWIPLIRALDRLRAAGVRGGLTLGVSPVLAEQLAHPRFARLLREYLEERERTVAEDAGRDWPHEPGRQQLAAWWRTFYRDSLSVLDRSGGNLLRELRQFEADGVIELATCGATHHYFPLLARDESIALQTELAVRTHERHFGRRPDGIWLPECGYRPAGPWYARGGDGHRRRGVEEIVAEAGLRWFVVDSALVSGGRALGSYSDHTHDLEEARRFTGEEAVRPVHPERDTRHSWWVASGSGEPRTVCFPRDPGSGRQVWCGSTGYPGDSAYLEFHRKSDTGGHRYWRITGPGVPLEDKALYSLEEAAARVASHADHFAHLVGSTLSSAADGAVLCAPYDAELFGHWWFEGVAWIEASLMRLARDPEVELTTLGKHRSEFPPEGKVSLPEGSWGEGGGHAMWRNPRVDWTWELVDAAEEEVWDLAARTEGTGGPARRFALAAMREFLLLGASDWAFLISTNGAPDYAAQRVIKHADDLARCSDAARRILDGGEPSAEDLEHLEMLDSRDDLFPDLSDAVRAAARVTRGLAVEAGL